MYATRLELAAVCGTVLLLVCCRLSISGQHVNASTPSAVTLPSHFSSELFHEETFAEDGQIEDIIAVDVTGG